jgi:hypothetical protein
VNRLLSHLRIQYFVVDVALHFSHQIKSVMIDDSKSEISLPKVENCTIDQLVRLFADKF